MKSTIFFIIAMIFVGANAQFLKSNDRFSVLTEIDNNHFGNMILSTVSVHMSTESPVEDVITLLNQVKTGLENDQAGDDQKDATDQARCDLETAQYQKQIKQNSENLATQKKVKADNEDLLSKAQSTLATTKNNIARNKKQFDDGTELRAAQAGEYKIKVVDHKDAIAAVDAAVPLIEKLKTGASSFIQMKSHFSTIQALLEKHRNSHPLYGPVIETLAQLATKADQETVNKILDLFARLRAALVESRKTEDGLEATRLADWAKRSADLIDEKNDLLKKKKTLETNIETYKSVIQNATELIQQYSDQLAAAEAGLKKLTAWCKAAKAKYLKNQAERTREVDILVKVIAHVESKLGGMKDYLKERVNKF